jgi:vacuolar-type H+-ATPase subunit H
MLSFEIDPEETVTPTATVDTAEGAAARMLQLAAGTADQLIADAATEAEALLATARAKADEIMESLAEEKAALEAHIATLRALESRHRSQMRDHLAHQLALLEGDSLELPTAVGS